MTKRRKPVDIDAPVGADAAKIIGQNFAAKRVDPKEAEVLDRRIEKVLTEPSPISHPQGEESSREPMSQFSVYGPAGGG